MALHTDDMEQDRCSLCETETDEMNRFDTNGDGRVDVIWCGECGALYIREDEVKMSVWHPPVRRSK